MKRKMLLSHRMQWPNCVDTNWAIVTITRVGLTNNDKGKRTLCVKDTKLDILYVR